MLTAIGFICVFGWLVYLTAKIADYRRETADSIADLETTARRSVWNIEDKLLLLVKHLGLQFKQEFAKLTIVKTGDNNV